MSRPWNADYTLSPEQAVRLIEEQFPILSPARLEPLGEGWDNAVYRVNGTYAFRFPRRKMGAELIQTECRLLPLIAPYLPLPIPVPEFIGAPSEHYAPMFTGCRFLPGTTACRVDWTVEERAENAESLAVFLACLHRIPISSELERNGPKDAIQRSDIPMRASKLVERLRADLHDARVDALIGLAEQLSGTPVHTGPLCWVHGDLYARHLLVDESKRVSGVIDWGDVHLGDPALDISIALSFLPPSAHNTFRRAYGGINEATWNRARFRALHYGVLLEDYGQQVGDEAIQGVGEQALRYVLGED